MRARRRFHDPCRVRVLLELLDENHVVLRQHVSNRQNVQIHEVAVLVPLGNRVALLLHVFFESLYVLHHQVFAGQLLMVREVIQDLHLVHTKARVKIEDALDGPGQRPEDVPLFVAVALDPAALLEVLRQYRLVEVCLPPELIC